MTKYFWIVVFAVAMTVSVDSVAFKEGPQAERQNKMSEEAPAGPWSWHGGD